MSAATPKRPAFFWGWVTLALALIGSGVTIFFISPPATQQQANALPWEAKVDEQGRLQVLGLTLNHSTPLDAMALYGKEVQSRLFTNAANQPISLEVFFEDMYIGYTLRGRLLLTLTADQTQLNDLYQRGGRVKVLDTGGREVTLNTDDSTRVLNYPIRVLTFIPYPRLDEQAIESRFGKPAQDTTGEDGIRRWHYPDRQLIILFDDSGRKVLQFGS